MLIVKKEDLDKMIAQCRREFPNEACGILAGPPSQSTHNEEKVLRRVTKVYEMTNAERSAVTFFMDAKEQLKVMKEMRALGLEMAGIYHSHVASQAYPSGHDVEMAFYSQSSYVIISIKDRTNPNTRSFKIKEGKITEEELKIE